MAAQPEIVLALVERGRLSEVLTGLHRGGYGHVVRVLDSERAEVGGQLRRAGADVPVGFPSEQPGWVTVMVPAPARTRAAADLLARLGAATTWEVERTAGPLPAFIGGSSTRPRGRRPATLETQAD